MEKFIGKMIDLPRISIRNFQRQPRECVIVGDDGLTRFVVVSDITATSLIQERNEEKKESTKERKEEKKELKTNTKTKTTAHSKSLRDKTYCSPFPAEIAAATNTTKIPSLEATPLTPLPQDSAPPPSPRPLTPLQRVVTAFKMLQGYPKDDVAWDKLNFSRCARSASALIDFCGSADNAIDCVQDVYENFSRKGLTVTLETVVKHAADWKKDKAEMMPPRSVNDGVLSMPFNGAWKVISDSVGSIASNGVHKKTLSYAVRDSGNDGIVDPERALPDSDG